MNSIRRTCRFVLAALLAAHLILPIAPCPADIYRWQDEQGHWHFSGSPPANAPIKEAPIPDGDTRQAAPSQAPARLQNGPLPADAPAPAPGADPILDLVLHQRAAAAGKSTAGLETAQEQLAVFDGLSLQEENGYTVTSIR